MGTFLANSRTFLNIVFLWRLKETPSDIMRRAMAIVRRVLLEVIYFWELSSIPKISEPFDTFLELLPVVIFYTDLMDDFSDISAWFLKCYFCNCCVWWIQWKKMTYSINSKWMLWYFLNTHEENPFETACISKAIDIFLYDICP